MRKQILTLALGVSLVAAAGAEVIHGNSTIFNPDGPKTNTMQDIPSAHKLGNDQQTQKIVVGMQSALPAYLEKSGTDGSGHRAADFSASQGTVLNSSITPQSAFGGGGKAVPNSNKLNPINL